MLTLYGLTAVQGKRIIQPMQTTVVEAVPFPGYPVAPELETDRTDRCEQCGWYEKRVLADNSCEYECIPFFEWIGLGNGRLGASPEPEMYCDACPDYMETRESDNFCGFECVETVPNCDACPDYMETVPADNACGFDCLDYDWSMHGEGRLGADYTPKSARCSWRKFWECFIPKFTVKDENGNVIKETSGRRLEMQLATSSRRRAMPAWPEWAQPKWHVTAPSSPPARPLWTIPGSPEWPLTPPAPVHTNWGPAWSTQPVPSPVHAQPAPAPVHAQPAPAPVHAQPVPAPVHAQPAHAQPVPTPVHAQPAPAPVHVLPEPAKVAIGGDEWHEGETSGNEWSNTGPDGASSGSHTKSFDNKGFTTNFDDGSSHKGNSGTWSEDREFDSNNADGWQKAKSREEGHRDHQIIHDPDAGSTMSKTNWGGSHSSSKSWGTPGRRLEALERLGH